jgi:hypothetical protein
MFQDVQQLFHGGTSQMAKNGSLKHANTPMKKVSWGVLDIN